MGSELAEAVGEWEEGEDERMSLQEEGMLMPVSGVLIEISKSFLYGSASVVSSVHY